MDNDLYEKYYKFIDKTITYQLSRSFRICASFTTQDDIRQNVHLKLLHFFRKNKVDRNALSGLVRLITKNECIKVIQYYNTKSRYARLSCSLDIYDTDNFSANEYLTTEKTSLDIAIEKENSVNPLFVPVLDKMSKFERQSFLDYLYSPYINHNTSKKIDNALLRAVHKIMDYYDIKELTHDISKDRKKYQRDYHKIKNRKVWN